MIVLNFVPGVGILTVRVCQRTVISFHIFSMFQLIVLHIHWRDFSFQDRNIKFSGFGDLLSLKGIDFDPPIGNVKVRNFQKCW